MPAQPTQIPDPNGYALMFLRFLTMKRASPHLNHTGHEPQPEDFGLTAQAAAFEREKVRREFERKK